MRDFLPFVGILIPIIALMIPIVALLTQHQRRMAELMRQGNQGNPNELTELRREVQQLKEIVSQQAIQMDDFLSNQRKLAAPPPAPSELQNRLG